MKKILFLPLLFALFVCEAQQPTVVSQPIYVLHWVKVGDSVRAPIYFQGIDTLATKAYARGFAGGSLTPGVGIKITGSTVAIDTLHYRKVDSLYPVTDSTFIVKINGVAYSYKMRGAVLSFNGRIGPVVPNKFDYTPYYPRLDSSYTDPSWITTLNWAKMVGLPNTLAGYGINNGVINGGGAAQWIADIEANRPNAPINGTFFFGIDDSIARYWNGSRYVIVSGGGVSAPDTVYQFKYGLLTTRSGDTVTVKLDTTTLKPIFGGGGSGIFQIFTKWPGIVINGTDTVNVDTTVMVRWSDTLARIASRSYVNTRGFITTETDPVAQAKFITLNQVANRGILITGTNAQSVGSSPVWSLATDSTYLATLLALKDSAAAIRSAIGPGSGITQIFTKWPGVIINGTDTVNIDTTVVLRWSDTAARAATQYYVNHQGFLKTEVDPVALNTNITLNQGRGIIVTGLSAQKLSNPPVWSVAADTGVLITTSGALVYLKQQDIRTTNAGTLPSGAGTRFEWIPSLKSLRVGSVTGNKWDSANIGPNTFALGIDNLVTGFGANFAAGDSNTINLVAGATAIGVNNFIQGYDATAIGYGDTAIGGGSIAMGVGNKASIGQGSIAMGQNAYASANGALAIGSKVTSHFANQVVMGMYNDSTNGALAFMLGWGNSGGRKNIFTIDSTGLATVNTPPLSDNSQLAVTSHWVDTNFLRVGSAFHLYFRSGLSGTGDTSYITGHDSTIVVAPIIDSAGFHHYIQNGRLVMYANAGGGTLSADTASIAQVITTTGDTLKVNTTSVPAYLGQKVFIPGYTPSAAGLMTRAKGQRLDSTVSIKWGAYHHLARAPWTLDSLEIKGITIEDTSGKLHITLRGDTTHGLDFNIDASGIAGTGTVDSVNLNYTSNQIFNATLTGNKTVNPTLNLSANSACSYCMLYDSSGSPGVPTYHTLSLTGPAFNGQGTTVQVYHGGGPGGNPFFGPVNMPTDVTGVMNAAQFPALGGVLSNTPGSLNISYVNGSIPAAAMGANSVNLASTAITGILPGLNGGTGVNNNGKTITLGGNFTTSGAFNTLFTMTAATNVTFPTSGTLLNTTGVGNQLSGITWTVQGTANQVLVNNDVTTSHTGNITLTLPQNLGTANTPTFTNLITSALTTSGIPFYTTGVGFSIGTALPNGFTATTQSANDNSTKVSTTAYSDASAAAAQATAVVNARTLMLSQISLGAQLTNGSVTSLLGTTQGTLTVAANAITQGSILKIHGYAVISNSSGTAKGFQINYSFGGGSGAGQFVSTSIPNGFNDLCEIEINILFANVGGGVPFSATAFIRPVDGAAPLSLSNTQTSWTGNSTLLSNTLGLTGQWSASSGISFQLSTPFTVELQKVQ